MSLTTAVTVAVRERLQRIRGAVPESSAPWRLRPLARDAFARFGKGRSPAGLNYGDCFSYALAQTMGRPLLFKGAGLRGPMSCLRALIPNGSTRPPR